MWGKCGKPWWGGSLRGALLVDRFLHCEVPVPYPAGVRPPEAGQGEEVGVVRSALAVACVLGLAAQASCLEVLDRVVLNEIYYYVPGFDAHNEYIELVNAGGTVAFLDGAVVTDEGEDGMPEGVFRFPGTHGGQAIPLQPGEYMLIAVDAIPGEIEPDLSNADFEFWHPGDDNDNPDVPNLVLVSGADADMALANAGDGLLLATGTDTTAAIDCSTVVDGVNWDDVSDPVPIDRLVCIDPEAAEGTPQGNSLARCLTGVDDNTSSADDWFMSIPTPGEPNIMSDPSDCATPVERVSWGLVKGLYR